MSNVWDVVIGLILFAASVALSFLCGMAEQRCRDEDEAVKNGVAEYYLDDNNERKFRWKK